MTPQTRAGDSLQEARVYLEDATNELRTAKVTLADHGADASAANITAILADLGALKDRIHGLEVQWQQQGRAAA